MEGQEPAGLVDWFLALMPDAAVVVDADGTIVSVNSQAETLFGYGSADLVGRPIEQLVPERFRHRHRRQRAEFAATPQARPMGIGLDLFGRRRDGTEFPVDISLAPIGIGERPLVVAAVRDATERKAAAAAQAQLATIVRSTQDGIVSMSPQGVLTSWNTGAERLFGYSSSQVVGRHVSMLVPDEESPALEELMDAAREGHHSEPQDTVWLTSDLRALDVAISVSPLDNSGAEAGGEGPGFSLLIRDITRRKADEKRLRRQERWQAANADIRLGLLSGKPLAESLADIADTAIELTGAEQLLVLQVQGTQATVAAQAGGDRDRLGQALDHLDAPIVAAIAADEPRLHHLTPEDRSSLATLFGVAGHGGWVAVVPMPVGERTSGALLSLSEIAPGEEELVILGSLAGQARLALELADIRADRDRLLISTDRERIARDLHDLVIQRLFGAGLRLQSTVALIGNRQAAERVSSAIEDLDGTIREIRGAIFALSSGDGGTGFGDRVRQLGQSMAESLGFEPTLTLDGPLDEGIEEHVQSELLAVLREALSNVARHAKADGVEVLVAVSDALLLRVVDNGVGLGDNRRLSGLANARARAQMLGGDLVLSRPDEGGTRFEWRVPLGLAAG